MRSLKNYDKSFSSSLIFHVCESVIWRGGTVAGERVRGQPVSRLRPAHKDLNDTVSTPTLFPFFTSTASNSFHSYSTYEMFVSRVGS